MTFQGLTWSLIPRIRNQVFLTHKLLHSSTYQSPQQPQPQVTVHDLKGDPWLDPKAEPPLEEFLWMHNLDIQCRKIL